ncbi:M15 family metallopeptidase [Nocardioides sp. MAHUQ-72]|uniref:M15 family metallopeptidase n=1 Tax=unclassified Nocardioides TaxID=2615069 RepID=UPI00361C2EA1
MPTALAVVVLLLAGACSTSPRARHPGTPSPRASGSTSAAPARPPYAATVHRIGPRLRARMRSSHGDGCPVRPADLRHLRLRYVDFRGQTHVGELVVHEDQAQQVADVFGVLYDAGWPIRRMRLVDAYGGDDDRSMAADNTSAFNCRRVTGGGAWSQHAYGTAIDIDPVENPYVSGSEVAPPAGRRFATIDRGAASPVPAGVIRADDVVVRAFARIGWAWGGSWTGSKDYQHFSATGR